MTPAELTLYQYLRRQQWRAIDAARAARYLPPEPLRDHAADLMDRERATWTEAGYTIAARLAPDDYNNDAADDYGTFTDDSGPDTVLNPRAERGSYKRFRPSYTIAERTADNRRAGMTRADATSRAIADAERDALRAAEASYCYIDATASRAGVELGRASVGGYDINPDPQLAYGPARHLMIAWIAESLADIVAEAIAEADKRRPIIAAALAE